MATHSLRLGGLPALQQLAQLEAGAGKTAGSGDARVAACVWLLSALPRPHLKLLRLQLREVVAIAGCHRRRRREVDDLGLRVRLPQRGHRRSEVCGSLGGGGGGEQRAANTRTHTDHPSTHMAQ